MVELFRTVRIAAVAAAASAGLRGADAPRLGPYAPDPHTLHLWHLDEARAPFADAVPGGIHLEGLHNGARPGLASIEGLGNAVSFHANAGGTPGASDLRGAALTASPILITGPPDNVKSGFRYFGPDGAFTYEALVKLDIMPRDAKCIALAILTMEGDDADRIFNFRIEREGYLAFFPLPHGGTMGGGVATIPTTGPHALETNRWFHVAVTYDGNSGTPGNLRLYWTKLTPGLESANCIGSGSLSNDFNGRTGDLAIGNEARSFPGNAEAEPFPGLIDEVRVSGVARHPTDFLFIPPDRRTAPERAADGGSANGRNGGFDLRLVNVVVDGAPVEPKLIRHGVLELGSGLHRLDFDFGFVPDQPGGGVGLQCLLEGVDERWRETERGMMLVCQILDDGDRVISQSRFQAAGRSDGWESSLEESAMSRRAEPVYLPEGSRKLRISLGSGSPDTTGFMAIDRIALHAPGVRDGAIWSSGRHPYDALTTSPAGYLPGWKRAGADPAIARLIIRENYPAIGLVDGDQSCDGEWFTVQELPAEASKGGVHVLSWDEVFNVIDGDTRRATYVNVPPGKYRFRAMGLPGSGETAGDSLELVVLIHPPFWQHVWFWPTVSASFIGLVAAGFFARHRARARRTLERLRFQNVLERDRIRIARDMHDDLGTRVTFINMSAALATQELDQSPEQARRHLARVSESARELISAMDDLVWAVDPAHDTLDELATHLTRMAEEMFRDTGIRCRLDIPALLPAIPLGSDFRHHVALAVKEALHNILRHAGPCEASLTLCFDGSSLKITVRDTGRGFDALGESRRHGLGNLSQRFREIGGDCRIESIPGSGTTVVFDCPVVRQPE